MKTFYSDKIHNRFLSKHNHQNKKTLIEEDLIETVLKPSDSSRRDKFIRNFLCLIDFLLEDIDLNAKFDNSENIYSINFRKIILGAAKGINKHKEIHFILMIYDLEIVEFIQLNPQDLLYYSKFVLFNTNKFFLNLKLEYGLTPKDYYTLLNTINVKSEINTTWINISSRALNSLFKFIVFFFFKFFSLQKKLF